MRTSKLRRRCWPSCGTRELGARGGGPKPTSEREGRRGKAAPTLECTFLLSLLRLPPVRLISLVVLGWRSPNISVLDRKGILSVVAKEINLRNVRSDKGARGDKEIKAQDNSKAIEQPELEGFRSGVNCSLEGF